MKKLNKKGFTLIEMLVVIAIIAILVAIIIPVVSAATDKAAAATDAANLRSFKAEIVTEYLNKSDNSKVTVVTASGVGEGAALNDVDCTLPTPAMKGIGSAVDSCEAADAMTDDDDFDVTYDGTEFTVTYQDYTIDDFAYYAENGEFPED